MFQQLRLVLGVYTALIALAVVQGDQSSEAPSVTPSTATVTDYDTSTMLYDDNSTELWDNTTTTLERDLFQHRLMKRLLNETYYFPVMGDPCLARMEDDGHSDNLSPLHMYCVCMLTLCDFVDHDLTPEEQELSDEYAANVTNQIKDIALVIRYTENLDEVIGVTFSYSLILVVGLIGNILVLVTVFKYMGKITVTNTFIASISAGDLLILVVVLPYQLSYSLYGFWEAGEAFCKITNIIYFMSFGTSSFSLLAMGVERYIVICHPLKAQTVSTVGRARKIVISVWILALACALPTLPMSVVTVGVCGIRATWFPYTFTYYLCVTLIVFALPMFVMAWAYSRVSIALYKSIEISQQLKNQKAENGATKKDEKNDEEVSRERLKVIRMLVILVVSFAVCWGPFWIVRSYRLWPGITNWRALMGVTKGLQTLTYLNSALNPILYNVASKPFRRGFLRACCFKSKRWSSETTYSASQTMSSAVSVSTVAK